MRRLTPPLVLGLLGGLAMASTAQAQVRLPVSGELSDAQGNPIDGTVTMHFALYAQAEGGEAVFEQSLPLPIDSGRYAFQLGGADGVDAQIFRDHRALWLGLRVDADEEMPRWQLSTAPFAAVAFFADEAETLQGLTPDDLLGAVGATGAQGPAGARGEAGATGAQGPVGATGQQGATGPAGAAGVQGPVGATGPAGATGPQGLMGLVGATGQQGPMGPAGAAGARGAEGPVGPAGATGPRGLPGVDGLVGATGPQGLPGIAGPTGARGATGLSGAMGPPGASVVAMSLSTGDADCPHGGSMFTDGAGAVSFACHGAPAELEALSAAEISFEAASGELSDLQATIAAMQAQLDQLRASVPQAPANPEASAVQEAMLKAPLPWEDAQFGAEVLASGQTIAVVTPQDASYVEEQAPGGGSDWVRFDSAVNIFEQVDTQWVHSAVIRSAAPYWPVLGTAFAMDGDLLVAGDPDHEGVHAGVNQPQETQPAPFSHVDPPGYLSGAVVVYERGSDGAWSQQAFIKPVTFNRAHTGTAVSISGDRLAASSWRTVSSDRSKRTGRVHLYRRDAGDWVSDGLLEPPTREVDDRDDDFAEVIELDGDTIVVGAPGERSAATGVDGDHSDNSVTEAGAAWVYRRVGADLWELEAYLKPPVVREGARFGQTLALRGDTLVVGTPGADSNVFRNSPAEFGEVFVFQRSAGAWHYVTKLEQPYADAVDAFGASVDLDGDHIVVGAPGEGGGGRQIDGFPGLNNRPASGAVFVYERSGADAWELRSYLKSSNGERHDRLGVSVGVVGDWVVGGAPTEDSTYHHDPTDNTSDAAGAVFVFGLR